MAARMISAWFDVMAISFAVSFGSTRSEVKRRAKPKAWRSRKQKLRGVRAGAGASVAAGAAAPPVAWGVAAFVVALASVPAAPSAGFVLLRVFSAAAAAAAASGVSVGGPN
eukprot:3559767-Pleurochrysis_carterae.AAC.2